MAYLLFSGEFYYPQGGAEDLRGKFDTVEAAVAAYDPSKHYEGGWANVLCLTSLKIVRSANAGEWQEVSDAES